MIRTYEDLLSMVAISYNISENLRANLKKIEDLRRKILITPLPRETEIKLKWQAHLMQIYYDLAITANKITKKELSTLLGSDFTNKKRLTEDEKEAVHLKRAMDYILQEWYMSSSPVTPEVILKLYKVANLQSQIPLGEFSAKVKELKDSLDYLQIKDDNPVIQAAVAHLQIRLISPFDTYNGRVARLTEMLFLYKNGYDFRGLLTINKFLFERKTDYQRILSAAQVQQNITVWLEFFTEGLIGQLEIASNAVNNTHNISKLLPTTYWKLSSRQKEILTWLETPGATINNREVQKRFKVSQITASRDLGKLTNLNLIFKHGSGRSVVYTKI